MANSMEKFGIEQFNGTGYDHWKFRMEILLDQHEVKICIEGEKTDPTAEFLKKDKKCKSIIIQCIANSHLQYVKDKTTGFQMWDALEKVFQRKGVASQLYLRRKLLTMKHNDNDSLESHYIKFDETIRELKSVGASLEDMDVVCHLLLTLPKSYDSIVTALETLDADKLKLEFVKGKLLDHEMKKKNQCEMKTNDSAAFYSGSKVFKQGKEGKGKFSRNMTTGFFKCHNCGKPGHKRAECRYKKQAHEVNHELLEEKHVAFPVFSINERVGVSSTNKVRWYIDSAATDHLVNDLELFSTIEDIESPIKIYVAKTKEFLIASKRGSIFVNLESCSSFKTAEIKNVLYVKELRHNLLSVQRLVKEGLKVVFDENTATIEKQSIALAYGRRVNNMFVIEFEVMSNAHANMCSDIDIWHERLGHLGYSNLLKLSKNNMVNNLNFGKKIEINQSEKCGVCIESKMSKLPFRKKADHYTKRPLEMVHSDICGPIDPVTHDCKRYFVTFLDDYTHFTMVYLLENKSDIFECFKNYEAIVTSKFNLKISVLVCDNGREYFSNNFKTFCASKGIQFHNTIPYTPELNGVAERLNRTILEKARAMIIHSKLNKSFWGEAVLCATYLLNRSPTATLENVTPAELFYNRKPDLKNLKVFGCLAYRHIPKEKLKGKFDSRSDLNIMVGYTHNGYRLWNIKQNKVITGRDVIFLENKNISDLNNVKQTLINQSDDIGNVGSINEEVSNIELSREEREKVVERERVVRIRKKKES